MLALTAVIIGVLLGLLCGGKLNRLETVSVPFYGVVLTLFVGQALARGIAAPFFAHGFIVAIWGACTFGIVLLLAATAQHIGLRLVALGSAMNATVVLLNNGMPVVSSGSLVAAVDASVQASHGFYHIADARTQLVFLGDILPAGPYLASLGDLLLAIGCCVFIVSQMRACE